jgi:hypothetical protein
MKISEMLARSKPRRPAQLRSGDPRNWPIRDWADLPAHHPKD